MVGIILVLKIIHVRNNIEDKMRILTPIYPGYWWLGNFPVKVFYNKEKLVFTLCGSKTFFEVNNVSEGLNWRGQVLYN